MTTYIPPTVLYIKQHSITGLKYFGKTCRNPYKYKGSGKYWKRHIKKHGIEHVKTIWVSEPYTDAALISEFALAFSKENNIIESEYWANMVYENGLDGGVHGLKIHFSEETRKNQSRAQLGKKQSPEHIKNAAKGRLGRKMSTESSTKKSISMQGKNRIPKTDAQKLATSKSMLGKKRGPYKLKSNR
jgi:hypothetical protein